MRTFVFVDTVAEVTREMAQGNESRALAAPFDGRVDVAAPSDGGAAFHDFVNRFGDAVGRRSTVLVLSDGRNNGRDPGLEALQAIRSRSARLVWLSPEPRGAWRLAGCDLPRYADRCDLLASAQNAAALERLARSIVRGRGRA